jgi:hypothetical protein
VRVFLAVRNLAQHAGIRGRYSSRNNLVQCSSFANISVSVQGFRIVIRFRAYDENLLMGKSVCCADPGTNVEGSEGWVTSGGDDSCVIGKLE